MHQALDYCPPVDVIDVTTVDRLDPSKLADIGIMNRCKAFKLNNRVLLIHRDKIYFTDIIFFRIGTI